MWPFKKTWTLRSSMPKISIQLFQYYHAHVIYYFKKRVSEKTVNHPYLKASRKIAQNQFPKKKSWNWPIKLMPATVSQILTIPTWKLDEQRLQQSIASRKINFHLSIMSSWIACWYSRSPGSRIVLKSRSNSLASHNIRTYNKFIRCFHQFVSLIFLSLSSSQKNVLTCCEKKLF